MEPSSFLLPSKKAFSCADSNITLFVTSHFFTLSSSPLGCTSSVWTWLGAASQLQKNQKDQGGKGGLEPSTMSPGAPFLLLSLCFHTSTFHNLLPDTPRVNSSYLCNIVHHYNSMLLNISTLRLFNSPYDPASMSPTEFQEKHVTHFFSTVSLMTPFHSFFSWQSSKMQPLVKKRLFFFFFRIILLQSLLAGFMTLGSWNQLLSRKSPLETIKINDFSYYL